MRKNKIESLFFLASLLVLACAEKRTLPTTNQEERNHATASSQTTSTSVPTVWPESFSKEHSMFFEEDALLAGTLEDLDGDGSLEAILLPGASFCGTSGCLSLQIFREEKGHWRELASLPRGVVGIPRVSKISVLASRKNGWRDIQLTGSSEVLLSWENGRYTPQGNENTEEIREKRESLLLQHLRDGISRPDVALGLWDKGGKNQGVQARVEVLGTTGQRFEASVGVLGRDWQLVLFPKEFAGATAETGEYRVVYWVGTFSLEGGSFRFP